MIKIMTDSTFYYPKEYAEEHDITMLSLSTLLGGVQRDEGYEENWYEYYETLKNTKEFPKSSQPSPDSIEQAFKDALEKYDEVLMLTISTTLSGTYQTACMIANQVDGERIHVLDTCQAALSSRLMLEEVVELKEQGLSVSEILEKADHIKSHVDIKFVPQNMEYLKRGGRIGTLTATIGNMLNIKPILSFKDGVIGSYKKVLGMSKAISELVNSVPATVKKIYVCYIHESNFVKPLLEKARERFNSADIELAPLGPVFGCHIGPGSIGLAYNWAD